ncbi:MAG TPA: thioesterase family protein [Stellaceae bacterium]|nr:thioesterase family protein [Stellaceae bacterium]
MTEWTETYRGTVAPWECDVTEHFTVAYYFDRIEQAAALLADRLEIGENLRAGIFPRRFNLRFARELRAGTSFHIESAAIGLDPMLRLGHRVVASAGGETATWAEEIWESPFAALSAARREAIGAALAGWDAPPSEPRPDPATMAGAVPAARGRVRPADLDELGHLSLAGFVHRFTDALLQAIAAIGLTGEYMQAQRRGFSTFELGLRIIAAPRHGEQYLVETGIAHLGSSSIRFVHRMTDPRTGNELARLGQFGVQLDLDARRPAPLAAEIRAAAAPLLLSSS